MAEMRRPSYRGEIRLSRGEIPLTLDGMTNAIVG